MTLVTLSREMPSARAILRRLWPCSLSFKIAVRVASSIMTALQFDTMDESLQIRVHARELFLHFASLALEQLLQQACLQCAIRTSGDAGERAQIIQEALSGRGWRRCLQR